MQVQTAGGGTQYVWTGDRWQTAPDGKWGHDFQTQLPLNFDDADGSIIPLEWVDTFELDVDVGGG